MFNTTLSQRNKRNIPATESQTVTLGPDETSFAYTERCPYHDSLTLCPYSQYCFSVISVFGFIEALQLMPQIQHLLQGLLIATSEAGEFTIFEIVLYFNVVLCCVVSTYS